MKGTHNSLSYAKPLHWWHNLFRFAWRCQDKTIEQQVAEGIKAFDIRIVYDSKVNRFYAAHGKTQLDIDPSYVLRYINEHCDQAYVRLVLETVKESNDFIAFTKFCGPLECIFPNITFFGGVYKRTWKCLYEFTAPKTYEQTLYQHIGSMQSFYGKIFPRLWAKLHRKDIPEWANDSDLPIVFLDFV